MLNAMPYVTPQYRDIVGIDLACNQTLYPGAEACDQSSHALMYRSPHVEEGMGRNLTLSCNF